MKPISAGRVIRILTDHDFRLVRQKGSHAIWKHARSSIMVPVPLHGKSKPIRIGTLNAIIKQSRIPAEEFMP